MTLLRSFYAPYNCNYVSDYKHISEGENWLKWNKFMTLLGYSFTSRISMVSAMWDAHVMNMGWLAVALLPEAKGRRWLVIWNSQILLGVISTGTCDSIFTNVHRRRHTTCKHTGNGCTRLWFLYNLPQHIQWMLWLSNIFSNNANTAMIHSLLCSCKFCLEPREKRSL